MHSVWVAAKALEATVVTVDLVSQVLVDIQLKAHAAHMRLLIGVDYDKVLTVIRC